MNSDRTHSRGLAARPTNFLLRVRGSVGVPWRPVKIKDGQSTAYRRRSPGWTRPAAAETGPGTAPPKRLSLGLVCWAPRGVLRGMECQEELAQRSPSLDGGVKRLPTPKAVQLGVESFLCNRSDRCRDGLTRWRSVGSRYVTGSKSARCVAA